MALFNVNRPISRDKDKSIAQRSNANAKKTVATTLRGGNTLLSKISTIQAVVEKNLGHFVDESMLITDVATLLDYLDACIKNNVISIDTETTGLDPLQDEIVGVCIYTPGQKTAYIPINHKSYITQMKAENQIPADDVRDEFIRLCDHKIDIIMFNAKFDMRFLKNQLGVKNIYCTWDTSIASRLLNENEPHKNLKFLHNKYCLDGKGDAFRFDDLFKGITFDLIPIKTGYVYAAHDAIITYQLYEYQKKYLDINSEREDMRKLAWVFHNIEMKVLPIVVDMEDTGVEFDYSVHNKLSPEYHKRLDEALNKCYTELEKYKDQIENYKLKNINNKLSDPINMGSPSQLAILLYDILGVESVDKKNPRGTGADILAQLDLPICKAILEYRTLDKLVGTYIDKLPDCVNPNDGRIHCNYNQYGADTGRFSSDNPNLQNIPSHNKDIRQLFKASDGYVLMSADYSQQEPKVMTQMCGDPSMLQAYIDGKDLYAQIASLAFNKPYEDCLEFNSDGTTNKEGKNRRSQAKSILLGILYGRGINSVAEQLHITKEKAQEIQNSVFRGFPAIKRFENESINMAKDLGYVTTLWGRKRRLPDMQLPEYEFNWVDDGPKLNDPLDFEDDAECEPTEIPEHLIQKYLRLLRRASFNEKRPIFERANAEGIWIVDNGKKIADATRQCVNSRIQGSAADMSKLAMILIGNDKRLKELGFRLLIPVHDELIAECPEENLEECKQRFAQLMSDAPGDKLHIPISCDVEITKNWYGETIDGGVIKKKELNTSHSMDVDNTRALIEGK